MKTAFIREIFLSIQGEGPHIGEEQLFIRFCGCNLNCSYCDTDFIKSKAKEYTPISLLEEVNSYGEKLTLSLTGGEPLLSVDFLMEFLPQAKANGHKIYLETNGTLPDKLEQIADLTDIIAADIKLKSCSNESISDNDINKFFKIASQKETFAKIVFNENITEGEILYTSNIAKTYNFEIILQPMMKDDKFTAPPKFYEKIFHTYKQYYKKVRLIPQMHKFINVR
jgi:organic radical activating enzyme